jgi:hypothetical protein
LISRIFSNELKAVIRGNRNRFNERLVDIIGNGALAGWSRL